MSNYTSIRVSTLRGDRKIPFNAFVQVAGKYILYCREGDSFEGARLERLKTKKLNRMFVPSEQIPKYNEYVQQNADAAYAKANGKSLELRTQIAQGLLQSDVENLLEDVGNSDLLMELIDSCKHFYSFFLNENEVLAHLLAIPNPDHNIAHHGIEVAALSLVIAQEMNLDETRQDAMLPLMIGAVLHDVENNFNNINLQVRPEELTSPEKKLYKRHSLDGSTRLEKTGLYSPLTIEIVRGHEERINGSGPLEYQEKDMDMLTRVVAVANVYDHLMMYDGLFPKEALKKLLIDYMGVLSLDCMKALQSGLKKRNVL